MNRKLKDFEIPRESVIPDDKKYLINNVGNYIYDGLKDLPDFDVNWNTLISSNPLLFEDVDYARIKTHQHIREEITPKELQAYQDGILRECYSTLDNLLMCNLEYYERIISYCTMVFFGYIRLDNDRITQQGLKKLPRLIDITPTKIWCCALMNSNSTKWEQMYAWEVFLETENLQENYNTILSGSLYFGPFIEYRAFINNTVGFRATLYADKTSNNNLATYCSKFTKSSLAVSDQQLANLHEYCNKINVSMLTVYNGLSNVLNQLYKSDDIGNFKDAKYYTLFIYPKELYILTGELTMRFLINDSGRMEKEYIANPDKCIRIEQKLALSSDAQLSWALQKPLTEYEYEKTQLKNILSGMLGEIGVGEKKYRNVVCAKIHNQPHCISKITFVGTRKMLTMNETLYFNSKQLREQRGYGPDDKRMPAIKSLVVTRNKENTINYIIDRGYYIFGTEAEVNTLIQQIENDMYNNGMIQQKTIINYYMNYSIPIITHLQDAITLNEQYKNDVIDKYIELRDTGTISEDKLCYEIHETEIKDINNTFDSRDILSSIVDKQVSNLNRKNYWQIVTS